MKTMVTSRAKPAARSELYTMRNNVAIEIMTTTGCQTGVAWQLAGRVIGMISRRYGLTATAAERLLQENESALASASPDE